jgi:creatinine amidohydrolase
VELQTAADSVAKAGRLAYLPVGSFEQHGAHLPLATDSLVADAITRRLESNHPGLVLPSIPVTSSHEHRDWRGTVSVPFETSGAYIRAVIASLVDQGFAQIVVVKGHGGNYFLSNLSQELNSEATTLLVYPTKVAYDRAFADAGLASSPHSDMHAGEFETSIALHEGFAVTGEIPATPHLADDRDLLTTVGMKPYAPNGYIGAPGAATSEKGQRILDSLATSFDAVLAELSVHNK